MKLPFRINNIVSFAEFVSLLLIHRNITEEFSERMARRSFFTRLWPTKNVDFNVIDVEDTEDDDAVKYLNIIYWNLAANWQPRTVS